MAYSIDDKLKIAVTSRALFQLEYENKIYEEEGLVAYEQYQLDHEDQPLKPGAAFSLVKALLSLNELADLKHKV
ncbi:MAG: 5'-nucleotidase, partial [Caldicoprobacterales bacterium]